ncbi:MAG: proline racemase family protein [Gammaproteobacteria bacterium]|nr:proline racemase family protein [Gammaproteobacteria bacterium]
MRWSRTLNLVDVHCSGEIGRVLTGGVLDIPGDTIAQKLAYINEVDDSLRRLVCSEPRSGPAGSVVLLLPATVIEADVGFIVLQADRAHAMSGSNAMCAVTAMLETGMKPMIEPETTVVLDTAAGLVRAKAACENGKVVSVTLDMPAAFVYADNLRLRFAEFGEINYHVVFGGVFYALVDVSAVGMEICPENARRLADIGVAMRADMEAVDRPVHPLAPEVNGISYVMFYQDMPDGSVKTATTMPPGRVDRSPCGTGSTARMALRHHQDGCNVDQVQLSSSTIGGQFKTQFKQETSVGSFNAIDVQVSGQSWIYGFSTMGLDPSDPFQQGFMVADTWGAI